MPGSEETVLFRRTPSSLRRGPVREFARTLRENVTRGREFHCLIADDRELRRLNRAFLAADYATDVLSFPSADRAGWLGEIAISADRAASQARQFGHSRLDEIRILMLHG